MILPNLLKSLGHLSVLSDYIILVLNVVDNSSLHQENTILVEGPYKKLPPINFLLDIAKSTVEKIKAILILHIDLSYDFQYILANLNTLLVDIIPCDQKDSEKQDNYVIKDGPDNQKRKALIVSETLRFLLDNIR